MTLIAEHDDTLGSVGVQPRTRTRMIVSRAVTLAILAVASWVFAPKILTTAGAGSARTAMMIVVTAGFVSVIGWRKLSVRLGQITSLAALAVIWGTVLALTVAALPSCPDTGGGRCGVRDVFSYGAVGMLFVVSIAAFVIPPILFGRGARRAYRFKQRLDTAAATRTAARRKRKRGRHGVSSKAHEANLLPAAHRSRHRVR